MSNSKSSDQDQDFLYISQAVDCDQSQDKQLMIQCINAYNMIPAKVQVQKKITHGR